MWIAAAVVLLIVALPGVALADDAAEEAKPKTSSLGLVRGDGAESCIAASSLARAVEARLGRKVFVSASDADLVIEGSIAKVAGGTTYHATIRMTDRDGFVLGERELESKGGDCAELDEELAFVVSVMIDPDAATRPPPEPPSKPEVEPPPPIVITKVVEKERRVVVPENKDDDVRWELGAAALGTAGSQPAVGYGFAPSVVVEFPGLFALLAEGAIAAPTQAEGPSASHSASASFMAGGVAICPLVAHPWQLHILGCAGWTVGGLLVEGEGFDAVEEDSAVITGPWLEGRLTLQIVGPLGVMASVGAFAPVNPTEVYYRAANGSEPTVWRSSPVAGLADVGLTLGFP